MISHHPIGIQTLDGRYFVWGRGTKEVESVLKDLFRLLYNERDTPLKMSSHQLKKEMF